MPPVKPCNNERIIVIDEVVHYCVPLKTVFFKLASSNVDTKGFCMGFEGIVSLPDHIVLEMIRNAIREKNLTNENWTNGIKSIEYSSKNLFSRISNDRKMTLFFLNCKFKHKNLQATADCLFMEVSNRMFFEI